MKKFNQFSKKKRSLHNYLSCIKSKVALVFLKKTLFIYLFIFFFCGPKIGVAGAFWMILYPIDLLDVIV